MSSHEVVWSASRKVMLVMTGTDSALSTLGRDPDELVSSVVSERVRLGAEPAVFGLGRPLALSQQSSNRLHRPLRQSSGRGGCSDGARCTLVPGVRHARPGSCGRGNPSPLAPCGWTAQTIPSDRNSWERRVLERARPLGRSRARREIRCQWSQQAATRRPLATPLRCMSIISSDEFISAVRRNKGPDRELVARQQILALSR